MTKQKQIKIMKPIVKFSYFFFRLFPIFFSLVCLELHTRVDGKRACNKPWHTTTDLGQVSFFSKGLLPEVILFFFFCLHFLACSSQWFHGMAAQSSGEWITSVAKEYGEQFTFLDARNNLFMFWNYPSITTS